MRLLFSPQEHPFVCIRGFYPHVILGDLGLLRGNGFQTVQRVYGNNKATGLTSDIPSEAELTPQLWGQWKFQTQP